MRTTLAFSARFVCLGVLLVLVFQSGPPRDAAAWAPAKKGATNPATGPTQPAGPVSQFSFNLDKPARTSAGIYDADDRLVRVLWTMKELPAGKHTGQWDGQDEFGQACPVGELDERGNPTYDWAKAREAIPKDASPLKFKPTMAQHADDGSVYAFGWSEKWPSPKNNPFWMGGTTLVRFDREGKRLWAVGLPEVCVGLDAVPGGGCMTGGGRKATIYHYLSNGLLVGSMSPGEAMCKQSGWMDNHASVAVNRDPRDGILDVFAEDDYVLRIGWYRVDDRDVRLLTGPVKRP